MAVKEILNHFSLITPEIVSILGKAYEAAQRKLGEELVELKDENEILQKKLSDILHKQVHGGDFDRCKFDYDLTNKKIVSNNKRILLLKEDLMSNLDLRKFVEHVQKYFEEGILTYEIIHHYIKKGIRRKNNSVRFILSDSDVEINENNISSLLEINPIYKSSVQIGDSSLDFDVIKIGGSND